MYRPFLSYSLAISVFAGLLIIDLNFIKNNNLLPPQISLQIDAPISDNKNLATNHQHESSKKIVKKSFNNSHHEEHIESDKNTDISKEKNLQNNQNSASNLKPIYQPLPDIPEELRYQFLKTQAIAKFYINANGKIDKVELIKPSNSVKINYLLLQSLKQWKFPASSQNSTQEIKIDFQVI
jgi:outer membrane biosynthesis protein TonB